MQNQWKMALAVLLCAHPYCFVGSAVGSEAPKTAAARDVHTQLDRPRNGSISPILYPPNKTVGITIGTQPEAFFPGGADPLNIVISASVNGASISVQRPIVIPTSDGVAIRIAPVTNWPYGTAITFQVTGTLDVNGVRKPIAINPWTLKTVEGVVSEEFVFYQDHERFPVTSDPKSVKRLLYQYYKASRDTVVEAYATDGATLTAKVDIVKDPLGQRGKVLHAYRRCCSTGHAIKVRSMFDRDTSYPNTRYGELYFYWEFMMPAGQEWPGGAKFNALACFDPNLYKSGEDVVGGNDCRTGFNARLMLHSHKVFPWLANTVPDGVGGSCATTYHYYFDHNHTVPLGKPKYGQIIAGTTPTFTGPINNLRKATIGLAQNTPVGLAKGIWNTIEMRVKMNTTPGDPTGSAFELWVNGYKTISLLDAIPWKPAVGSDDLLADPTDYGIQEFWLELFHGGGKRPEIYGSITHNDYYFDNVIVSESRIGTVDRISPFVPVQRYERGGSH